MSIITNIYQTSFAYLYWIFTWRVFFTGNEGHNIEHSHVHDSNHIEDEKNNRRIDNEVVRELVDCGGSDLGFCDMNSRYPG